MREAQALWARLTKQVDTQLRLAWATMPARLSAWRTQVVSLRKPEQRQAAWWAARPLLVFAAAYVTAWSYLFVAAFLGAKPPPAPLFPPGAVLLCALLLTPPRRWWLYLAVAFVIQVPILAYLGLPLGWNLVGYIPDAIEPVLAVGLMRRFIPLPPRFASLREVTVYTACVAAGVLVAATVGAAVNMVMGGQPYGSTWRTWFLGDTLSDLVLAPTLFLWIAAGTRGLRAGTRWRYAEAALLYGGLLVIGLVVFDTQVAGPEVAEAFIYLPVPLLLWAAVRFGPRGIATALSLIVVLVVPGVANALGPFASRSVPAQATQANVFTVQLYLLVVGVPLLFLAALVRESEVARRETNAANRELSRLQVLTDTALSNLAVNALLEALLDRIRDVMGVDNVAILLIEESDARDIEAAATAVEAGQQTRPSVEQADKQQMLVLRAVRGPEEAVAAQVHVPVGKGFAGQIAATRAPLTVDDLASFPVANPFLHAHLRSALGVPLLVDDRLLGVVHVGSLATRQFTEHDVRLLQRVADRIALAIDRAHAYETAEAARVEAERQAAELEATFEAMADGVTVFDTAGRLVRDNAAQRRLLGLDAEATVPPDYAALSLAARMELFAVRDEQGNLRNSSEGPLPRAMHGEVVSGAQTRIIRVRTLDGREVEVGVSAAPLRDRNGQVTGAVVVLRDQTEHNRVARERAEQAEQLDRLFEQIADGLIIYDAEGRIVRENPATQRLLGLETAPPLYYQLPARDRVALFAARDDQGRPLAPEDWPLMRVLRGEGAGAITMDIQGRTLDGRDVEIRTSAAPLRDPEGRLVGVVSVLHDQTEQKRLEHEREVARTEAERQAEQLDRIFEGMGEGVFVYDRDGQVVRTNAAARRLLGLGTAPLDFNQLPAEERLALYAPRDGRQAPLLTPEEWLVARVLRGDPLSEAEAQDIRMRSLDGRELEASASVAPLHDPQGQVVGAVLILSDRTERNRLEREREEARASELAAREMNQRLDTFVAMVTHDLRAPVAVSKMEVQGAQRRVQQAAVGVRPGTGKGIKAFAQVVLTLERIERNLDRLWRLVQQLLDASRIRQGTLVLDRQPLPLADLVRACVEEQRQLAPSRTITLDLPDPGAEPVVVEADADRLGQVVTNYLTNAVRYSPEDQPIAVTLRVIEEDEARDRAEEQAEERAEQGEGGAHRAPGRARLVARVEVRDHGAGIAPEEQQTIWDRFQRAQSVREASGLGLGLYIARTLVKLHGGRVGVESAVGQGSTFWFTIPLAVVLAGVDPPRAPAEAREAGNASDASDGRDEPT